MCVGVGKSKISVSLRVQKELTPTLRSRICLLAFVVVVHKFAILAHFFDEKNGEQ